MRIMKYVLALVFALGLAIPSFAVELSLGGFPSFMRFRWRSLHNATYHNILTPGELAGITGLDGDATGEHIHFADMTLRFVSLWILMMNWTPLVPPQNPSSNPSAGSCVVAVDSDAGDPNAVVITEEKDRCTNEINKMQIAA